MTRLLPPDELARWSRRYWHGVDQTPLRTPAIVADRSDPRIAHLDGLNLSRAWCWRIAAPDNRERLRRGTSRPACPSSPAIIWASIGWRPSRCSPSATARDVRCGRIPPAVASANREPGQSRATPTPRQGEHSMKTLPFAALLLAGTPARRPDRTRCGRRRREGGGGRDAGAQSARAGGALPRHPPASRTRLPGDAHRRSPRRHDAQARLRRDRACRQDRHRRGLSQWRGPDRAGPHRARRAAAGGEDRPALRQHGAAECGRQAELRGSCLRA